MPLVDLQTSPTVFFVPGLPVGQPRQRHTKTGHNYTPATHPVQAFRYAVAQAAREATCGKTLPLYPTGAVTLEVALYFPRPKALQWKTKPWTPLRHTKKPDLDNVLKALKDALKGITWADDAQVARLAAEKWICSAEQDPGVVVWMHGLGEE